MEILILGTVPLPLGGVSVHISRLLNVLENSCYRYKFVDLRKNRDYRYLFNLIDAWKHCNNKIIHYQLNNWYECALIVILFKKSNNEIIYTVHSFPQDYKIFNIIKKIAYKISCRKVSIFIAPSDVIKNKLIENGIIETKIKVINTYLPPTDEEKTNILPEELFNELKCDKKIILACGSKLYKDKNGIDLYGLDMCIEACYRLEKKYKFIFCVPIIEDRIYFNELLNKIDCYNIKDNMYIYTESISLVSVYKYCHLFVRPTNSDSYGISVAEALDAGVPALASDVCDRTKGCYLFKNRNMKDFCEKIDEILNNEKIVIKKENDSCEKYLFKLYEELGYSYES